MWAGSFKTFGAWNYKCSALLRPTMISWPRIYLFCTQKKCKFWKSKSPTQNLDRPFNSNMDHWASTSKYRHMVQFKWNSKCVYPKYDEKSKKCVCVWIKWMIIKFEHARMCISLGLIYEFEITKSRLKNVPPFKWITKANDGVEFPNSNLRFVILVHQGISHMFKSIVIS